LKAQAGPSGPRPTIVAVPRFRPTTWLALAFLVAGLVATVVSVFCDRFDDWATNVAVEAFSLAATVLIVEWVLRLERRAHLRPRVERVLYDIGLDFRLLMSSVILDYAATHLDTYRPLPSEAVAVLDQWIADHDREDEPRRPIRGETVPTLLLSATEFSQRLLWFRETDRDVMEPDLVRAIDDMTHRVSLSRRMLGWQERSDREQRDVERIALAGFVRVLRDFAIVLRRYDDRWMKIMDLTIEAADATREQHARARREGRTLPS
jgi:hypothetical protein